MRTLLMLTLSLTAALTVSSATAERHQGRSYTHVYSGEELSHVAFPIGGMGAGMFCMDGTGSVSHLSLRNHPDLQNIPYCYAAIHVKGIDNGTKVLEGQVPAWKTYGPPQSGMGMGDRTYGLPRFSSATFQSRFPFADIQLTDAYIPLKVTVTAWSPFIPTDEDNSSLPVGIVEYRFHNPTDTAIQAIFSFNTKNIVDPKGSIKPLHNGFRLQASGAPDSQGLAVYVDSHDAVTDHCWFRGDWFDAQSVAWKHATTGTITENPPTEGISPGASLYVPFALEPHSDITIRLNYCWYFPDSDLSRGIAHVTGDAFLQGTSGGTEAHQNTVSGYQGARLLNSFGSSGGDGLVGEISSPTFVIDRKYMKFLVGGGSVASQTAVRLVVDGNVVRTASGLMSEHLDEHTWDISELEGRKAHISIIDRSAYPWGHIMADQFFMTDRQDATTDAVGADDILIEDFEHEGWGGWTVAKVSHDSIDSGITDGVLSYKPWYGARFDGIQAVIDYWNANSERLRAATKLFSDTFYDTSLPAEVIEAVAANLSILKSTTVLRQHDGRLWAWEGSEDNVGSCHGSCTHVWNYAQAIPHLFPRMERTLRETEFLVSQNEEGHQNFRSNIPISRPPHDFHAAADGQLGGIMKVYREWRISGSDSWLLKLYPRIKSSLDYCINTWDPTHAGALQEPHHNTYDIEFWGPDGMCNSIYIGALEAFTAMSRHLGMPCRDYEKLLKKSVAYMNDSLYDGEYFIQNIRWTGLKARSPMEIQSFGGSYSSSEAQQLLHDEGPKYQYGKGCLADGVIGMWMASACGLPQALGKTRIASHLNAVYRYNLRHDLLNHSNTQRPSYALGSDGGLLLCTWPKGSMPTLPFVYSNEVWTGIEYQVASHLMAVGEVDKGLDIVRTCRSRYDGVRRNPFDEIECGHWYARALSSYSMLQSLTGARYDAVERTMYVDSRIGDFRSFISTESGFGTLTFVNGKADLNVVYGTIDVQRYSISENNKKNK